MPRMMPRRAVEVYVTDVGYVCIKQTGDMYGDADSLVLLEPSQVLTVIRWMQDALPDAERQFTGIEEDTEDNDAS